MNQSNLETFIRKNLKKKNLLLMTHLIAGYPSFEDNERQIKAMTECGVSLIELQIPFSEPSADGPVIAGACQISIDRQTTVDQCFEFAKTACQAYPNTAFMFMTYLNILYRRGYETFIRKASEIGIKGLIIPDLPPELAEDPLNLCRANKMAMIFIYTPTTTEPRLQYLATQAQGMIYCVGRTGVTGKKTDFSRDIAERVKLYRKTTNLPLAIGFGISEKKDIEFLHNKFDIAVIGTKLMTVYEESGENGIRTFLKSIS